MGRVILYWRFLDRDRFIYDDLYNIIKVILWKDLKQ